MQEQALRDTTRAPKRSRAYQNGGSSGKSSLSSISTPIGSPGEFTSLAYLLNSSPLDNVTTKTIAPNRAKNVPGAAFFRTSPLSACCALKVPASPQIPETNNLYPMYDKVMPTNSDAILYAVTHSIICVSIGIIVAPYAEEVPASFGNCRPVAQSSIDQYNSLVLRHVSTLGLSGSWSRAETALHATEKVHRSTHRPGTRDLSTDGQQAQGEQSEGTPGADSLEGRCRRAGVDRPADCRRPFVPHQDR